MTTPHVSLLMVVFNRASLVETSIESLLAQTFRNFELVVVDDGSTDGTLDIIRRIPDPRIRIAACLPENSGRREGIGRVRNLALAASRAPLAGVMDSDDLRYPSNLEILSHVLDTHSDAVLAGGLNDDIGLDGMPLGTPTEVTCWRRTLPALADDELQQLVRTNEGGRRSPFSPASVLMRRAHLVAIGGYDEARRYEVDSDIYRRLATRGRVELVPTSLSAVRVHEERLSAWKRREGWPPPAQSRHSA